MSSWAIKESLFTALGIFNNSSKSKVVFVTWGFDCLYTHIFKKSGDTSSLTDTYKILLNGTIQDIIVTEYNTMVLMTIGQIYYFASCKNLKRLKFLKGVKCIAPREKGFAIIKVDENNGIFLETYIDFPIGNDTEASRTAYDISFDDMNIFNTSWNNERFFLLPVKVTLENKGFLQLITKQTIECSEIFLFSIFNNLCCLFPSTTETNSGYEIEHILTVSSEICSIRLMDSVKAFLIFLSCGVVEIIFYSHLMRALDRTQHIIGPDLIATAFANDFFFYSDGENIVKVEFTYDQITDTCIACELKKFMPNMIALTWVQSVERLVCVSENNIFYRTKFTSSESSEHFNDEFFEVDNVKLQEIENHFKNVVELMEEPCMIEKQIDTEIHKQEVIAVAHNKDIYSTLISAEASFHTYIPQLKVHTLFPSNKKTKLAEALFLLVSFKLTWSKIFRTGLWNLLINICGGINTTYTIKLTKMILQSNFNIMVPVEKGKFIFPLDITIELGSFVNVGNDFMLVVIPVNLKDIAFSDLFATKLLNATFLGMEANDLDKIFCKMAESNAPLTSFERSEKKLCAKLRTPLIMTMRDLNEMFKLVLNDVDESKKLVLHFLGEEVTITYLEDENYLEIETADPVALFHTKLCILKKLSSEYYDEDLINVEAVLPSLVKIRCELEELDVNVNFEDSAASTLIRLYKELRGTIREF